jgi:hypothetical protein
MKTRIGLADIGSFAAWTGIGLVLALLLGLIVFESVQTANAQGGRRVNFDHNTTGFPLTGEHARQDCDTCHRQGMFKGTPTQCIACHIAGSGRATTSKPSAHVATSAPCEQCHTSTLSWMGARFSHAAVAPGSCASCHNGHTAPGKPTNHVMTTASCDTCHRTTAWIPAGFNHANVAPGSCATCHNGSQATGKPANHPLTTASCDSCHRTTAWIPATFSHTNVAPGTCANCHNGSQATGKPANHVMTTASCDACHRTTAWIPATFSHTNVAPGTCANCHNGSQATGKPSGHFVTTRACDACHSTTAWIPVLNYSHTSPYYSTHAGVTCAGCHTGNSEVIAWPYSTYKPDCAGCHAGNFKPDSHKKTESPSLILYTVSELRNCAGSCHMYNDNTFTTIKEIRNSEHRSTDGSF